MEEGKSSPPLWRVYLVNFYFLYIRPILSSSSLVRRPSIRRSVAEKKITNQKDLKSQGGEIIIIKKKASL
jgi:hypothetical protein